MVIIHQPYITDCIMTHTSLNTIILLTMLSILPVHCELISDRILMSDIRILYFAQGYKTAHRRYPVGLDGLECIGYNCDQYRHNVKTAICKNMGVNDAGKTIWECSASLPPFLKLSNAFPSCEGYDHAGDEYVLVGSCSMKYQLEKIGNDHDTLKTTTIHTRITPGSDNIASFFGVIYVFVLFVLVMMCIASPVCRDLCKCTTRYYRCDHCNSSSCHGGCVPTRYTSTCTGRLSPGIYRYDHGYHHQCDYCYLPSCYGGCRNSYGIDYGNSYRNRYHNNNGYETRTTHTTRVQNNDSVNTAPVTNTVFTDMSESR